MQFTLRSDFPAAVAGAAMQAMEAIKLIAGVGTSASLQILDAKSAEWRSVRVKKDPGCKICSVP